MSNSVIEKTTSLPPYTPETFINRKDEIGLVTKKAEALATEPSIDERTIVFMGQRGTGKSWLMLHLLTMLKVIDGVISYLIDLKEYSELTPDAAVERILRDFGQLFGYQISFELDLAELSREFMQNLRSTIKERSLVLLIDTVFESDWRLLAVLESYLLGPLSIERRVLIVMAGRGQAYPWKTPELRLRAKFWDLEEFDPEHTKIQLEAQKLESVLQFKKIHKLSQGNPLANYMLAVQPDEQTVALDQTIDELLEVVTSDRRKRIRENLESLCVLKSFDEEQIPTMLAAYYGDDKYSEWKPSQARQVREEIVTWSFAHWDETKKGYVIDSTLFNLMQQYLKTESQQYKWKNLNCAAYDLYISWTEKYKRTSKRWQTEANYHVGQLKELGFSLEDCSRFEN